ncbi:MAG: hypothetical protein M3070_04150 [Actinomycetota bacterium]|nr:hypothetical protein [Actinomycetota bacterium]
MLATFVEAASYQKGALGWRVVLGVDFEVVDVVCVDEWILGGSPADTAIATVLFSPLKLWQ